MIETEKTPKKKTYMRVLIGCFLICALSQSSYLVSYSINLKTWVEVFNVSVFQVTLTHAAASCVAAIINIWFAKHIIRKIGYKKSFYFAAVAGAVSYTMYGMCQSYAMLVIAAAISGFVAVFGGMTFVSSCINNWFMKNAKFAFSILAASIPAGNMATSFALGRISDAVGWRTSMFILAGAVLVGISLLSTLMVIDSPEKVGQRPVGYGKGENESEEFLAEMNYGVDEKTARSTALYWVLLVSILMLVLVTGAYSTYLMPMWQDTGMTIVQSGDYSGIFHVLMVAGIVIFGFIADKFELYKLICTGLGLGTIGTAIVVYLGGSGALAHPIITYIAFALIPIVIALASIYSTYVVRDVFGRKYFSQIIGTFSALNLIAGIINAPIFGTLVDATGSYTKAWWFEVGFCCMSLLLAVVVGLLSGKTKRKLRAITEQENSDVKQEQAYACSTVNSAE